MNLWILDTDHLTLFQNDHPLIKQRINQINPENIAVTVVTFEEQMRGWLNAINQSSQSERVIWAYKGLSDGIKYFNNVKLLDFTQDAYSCYKNLVRQRIRVGTQDLRIAAIALSVNGIVVTRNHKDFGKVPNLTIEDWTVG
ncbi:type II toxin-antitoxin system VapC family toxin [Tolypothrix sp. VBCCA 56010]|uniref:type II toxin-antitoxin system VapC family toxin n=1 Tax=Tolypothrix sp. VBCCA 56010 TaxID=3137731 RepID=UPI003D7D65DB